MNSKKLLKEILATHADELVKGETKSQDFSELSSEDEAALASLLDIAARVESTLKPAPTTGNFVADLKRELLTTAHLRRAEGYTPPNPSRDLLILVAIIGFILALAGVLVALRLRERTA